MRRRRLAPQWEHVTWVQSDSDPDTKHELKRHLGTSRLGCDCGRYRFARGEKTCHHIQRFEGGARAALLLATTQARRPGTKPDTLLAARVKTETYTPSPDATFSVRVDTDVYTFTRRSISFSTADL